MAGCVKRRGPPGASPGGRPIRRVVCAGQGHGSVWINGHNLGRSPEKTSVNGQCIPECRPDYVTISAKAAASRDVLRIMDSRSPGVTVPTQIV